MLALCGAALMFASLPVAHAIDEPEHVISYRQSVMKAMGAHITAIAAVAKGEVSYVDQVESHAAAMAGLAEMIPNLFPSGTDGGNSKALPTVWSDTDKFQSSANRLIEVLPQLIAAGQEADAGAVGRALGVVGRSCSGCHDNFRQTDD